MESQVTLREGRALLVLRLRESRRRAVDAAQEEVASLLRMFNPKSLATGPLVREGAVSWLEIDDSAPEQVASRLHPLGYSRQVLMEVEPDPSTPFDLETTRFCKQDLALARLWDEPDRELRRGAPDKRRFRLEMEDGEVRVVRGYRGGSGPLERRALPVEDARLLVNLTSPGPQMTLLDPFAGSGGVVLAALAIGLRTMSCDIDPRLRFGLSDIAMTHVVADASALPLVDNSVEVIATEPPYHPSALQSVLAAISEFRRVLVPGGRTSLLVQAEESAAFCSKLIELGFRLEQRPMEIDRRGTAVTALCATSPPASGSDGPTDPYVAGGQGDS